MKRQTTFIFLSYMLTISVFAQEILEGVVETKDGTPIFGAVVHISGTSLTAVCDEQGYFSFQEVKWNKFSDSLELTISIIGYEPASVPLKDKTSPLHIFLEEKKLYLKEVVVSDRDLKSSSVSYLRAVEDMAIYAGKKSEVIYLSTVTASLATNNARQIFSSVPGLNIWESDRAGLQLGIGGRGLNPNRTSNFNTRQNGYDISADALGYPESYYTPPPEAVDRIEMVRGAASLQYGSQFGGMINFKLKEGDPDKKISVLSKQTVGSWGLFSSFNSVSGEIGAWNYYTFFQHKQGFGARPNAHFDANIIYLAGRYLMTDKLEITTQYTYMNYLAQQSGGLTDRQFALEPFQSLRARNWFSIHWNLFNLSLDYEISARSKINIRNFGLFAYREAIGILTSPTKEDFQPYQPRDFIYGRFANMGNETRWSFRYGGEENTTRGAFLLGARFYFGNTHKKQGVASDDEGPYFTFLPNERMKSDYIFPSKNIALFAEHVFFLGKYWRITPGFRWEYIETAGQGVYDASVRHPSSGEIILKKEHSESPYRARNVLLYGLGLSYKSEWGMEIYTNFSRNYKAINFNDVRIITPNAKVDENIQDERGYNFDIGTRGKYHEWLRYDFSFFFLEYGDRIGAIHKEVKDPFFGSRLVRFRTNVADASILGVESFVELGITTLLGVGRDMPSVHLFANLAWIDGNYESSQENGVSGNKVELVPDINLKTGGKLSYQEFKMSYQFTYVGDQYTEASNTTFSSSGSDGLVPAYFVMDLSASYAIGRFSFDVGVNNLSDEVYFTRRAVGYPGPGIIPADSRNYYFTISLLF